MPDELFDSNDVPTGLKPENPARVVRIERPDRSQVEFRTDCLDERIPDDHAVRMVWHFVEELDVSGLHDGFHSVEGGPGRSVTDRRILFALWLYAYGEGIGSARRINDLCQRDDSYRWLAGGVSLNYHTIADFRSRNGKILEDLFVQSLAVLMNEDLIDVTRLTNDGTKIRAKAKASSFRRESKLDQLVAAAEEHIKTIDRENKEGLDLSKRDRAARARHAREKFEKCEQAVKELEKLEALRKERRGKKKHKTLRVSTTEPEAKFMKFGGSSAFHPAYNVQVSSTLDTHVIVAIEPTQDHTDASGLQTIIPLIRENTGVKPEAMVTDLGFLNRATVDHMQEQQIKFYAPGMPTTLPQSRPNYCRDNSIWSPDEKTVQCPEGHAFSIRQNNKRQKSGSPGFVLFQSKICRGCPMADQCFPGHRKSVVYTDRRHADEQSRAHNERINTAEGQSLLKLRCRGELQNAKIKDQLALRQFHVQGLDKVRNEALLVAIAHNLKRLIALRACAA